MMDLAFAIDMMDEVVKRNCLTVGVEAWQTVKAAVLAQQQTTPQACNAAYPGTGPVVIGGTAGVA